MTTQEVIKQFLARKSAHSPIRNLMYGGRNCSISTDGARLWSYNTVIAQWSGDTVLVNNTKYSRTTSKQCGILRNECNRLNVKTEAMKAMSKAKRFEDVEYDEDGHVIGFDF